MQVVLIHIDYIGGVRPPCKLYDIMDSIVAVSPPQWILWADTALPCTGLRSDKGTRPPKLYTEKRGTTTTTMAPPGL